MKIVLIGSGNVAAILGKLIVQNHHTIVHVASRNIDHAAALARQFDTSFSTYNGLNDVNADMFILAVSDAAIPECISKFSIPDKLLVHTAGSVSKDILKNTSLHYGILYPLQSLRKEMTDIPDIPLLVDGSDTDVTKYIEDFARSLTSNVQIAGDEDRLKLHTAAVIVSNFTNHLYALAEDFCKKEKVNFELLKPLIVETAQRIVTHSPAEVQTGPAARKDIQTLDKHLRLLADYPRLRYLYLKLTDSIMNP